MTRHIWIAAEAEIATARLLRFPNFAALVIVRLITPELIPIAHLGPQ
jgi:hypothetical protein